MKRLDIDARAYGMEQLYKAGGQELYNLFVFPNGRAIIRPLEKALYAHT